jgi:hypothetical protein
MNQGGGAGSAGNDVGGFAGGSGGAGGGTGGTGASCAGTTSKAKLVPIDMYIMLDKSGSMSELTGAQMNGPSKWDAISKALNSFFVDPNSAGLGVGLQFFPITAAGVPDTCTSSAQCNGHGPCLLNACLNDLQLGQITACDKDSDCQNFDSCVPLGQCQNNTQYVCIYQNPQVDCGQDPAGNDLGPCDKMTQSFCVNADSCTAGDYSTPAVEIATLNGASANLKAAIAATKPSGSTPTSAALDGAIQHAKTWAGAHPDHKVVAVMATDGLPTECMPQDIQSIAQIAADGKAGSPSVLTFVIGIFGANDAGAGQNLDAIASAGGTDKAFLIKQNQDVNMAFLNALHQIQGQTLACEYEMPAAPNGQTLDYGKVNVEYTPPGAAMPTTIFYVAKAGSCDPNNGGWYYDKDPQSGATPTKIEMCPATCDKLKAGGGQVDIEVGCETIVPK